MEKENTSRSLWLLWESFNDLEKASDSIKGAVRILEGIGFSGPKLSAIKYQSDELDRKVADLLELVSTNLPKIFESPK